MSHGRFFTYRMPRVTVLSRYGLGPTLRASRPEIPVVEVDPDAVAANDADAISKLKEAEVLFGEPLLVAPVWSQLGRLRWFQSTWAGNDALFRALAESSPRASETAPPFVMTRFSGQFGPQMAEFVISHVVAHHRKIWTMLEAQRAKKWIQDSLLNVTPLSKLAIGILGVGDIGREIARVCKVGFGMKVLGLVTSVAGRTEAHIDELFDQTRLPELLHESDVVCNVLPSTPRTVGLLSGEVLSYCRPRKPLFINVGRGDIIDVDSLVHALEEGYISRAVLDVYEKEPLPPESPLWDRTDVFVSPHVSAPTVGAEVVALFGENFENFVQEKPLKHVVDWRKGY